MVTEKVQNIFFLILFSLGLILLGVLFYPFLGALTIALTLAITFRPLFRYFLKIFHTHRSWAGLATIIIILLIVIIPLFLLGLSIFNEVSQLYYSYITGQGIASSNLPLTAKLNTWLDSYAPGMSVDLSLYQAKIIEWLFTNLNRIFSSTIGVIFNLLIIFITLFFLFKDGDHFKKTIRHISPLNDDQDEAIIDQLETAANSVMKGTILVALAQGLAVGLGFAVFGLSRPVIGGVLGSVASIVPGVGTSLVFVPVVIYLTATGSYFAAIGLALWGTLVVGMIDNILRPIVVDRGIKVHPLFTLLSVLGGLEVFGALGFIIGPMILSFVFALGKIYLLKNK